MFEKTLLASILVWSVVPSAFSQDAETLGGRSGRDLLLRLYRPRAAIKVEQHVLSRAKFPVVDVHTHLRIRTKHSPEQLDEFVQVMDRNQIAVCVSLDGGLGDALTEHLDYLKKHGHRFVVFANIDWRGDGKEKEPATWDCQRPDFARRIAKQLADGKQRGVAGLKLFKQFGLEYQNADGSLLKIDDTRWDEIWRACGELGLPVILHTADPSAF